MDSRGDGLENFLDIDDNRLRPLFILAPMRSYSTVAVAMLSGHPRIYGFPELMIFSVRTVGDFFSAKLSHGAAGRRMSVRLSGICRALSELHEASQEPDAVERARQWLLQRSDWPTTRLFDHLSELVMPRIPLEKSPDTVISDESLAYCMNAYPEARYIHLTRHPVTAQGSIMEYLGYLDWSMTTAARAATAAAVWYASHGRIIQSLTGLPGHQWFRLRAEDLLGNPQAVLPGLLDWLGLEYDTRTVTSMLRTECWPYAGTGTAGRLLGGDYKFMQAPKLRPIADPDPEPHGSANLIPDKMCARMKDLARYLGYA